MPYNKTLQKNKEDRKHLKTQQHKEEKSEHITITQVKHWVHPGFHWCDHILMVTIYQVNL